MTGRHKGQAAKVRNGIAPPDDEAEEARGLSEVETADRYGVRSGQP
jgi:hypothetical protein